MQNSGVLPTLSELTDQVHALAARTPRPTAVVIGDGILYNGLSMTEAVERMNELGRLAGQSGMELRVANSQDRLVRPLFETGERPLVGMPCSARLQAALSGIESLLSFLPEEERYHAQFLMDGMQLYSEGYLSIGAMENEWPADVDRRTTGGPWKNSIRRVVRMGPFIPTLDVDEDKLAELSLTSEDKAGLVMRSVATWMMVAWTGRMSAIHYDSPSSSAWLELEQMLRVAGCTPSAGYPLTPITSKGLSRGLQSTEKPVRELFIKYAAAVAARNGRSGSEQESPATIVSARDEMPPSGVNAYPTGQASLGEESQRHAGTEKKPTKKTYKKRAV